MEGNSKNRGNGNNKRNWVKQRGGQIKCSFTRIVPIRVDEFENNIIEYIPAYQNQTNNAGLNDSMLTIAGAFSVLEKFHFAINHTYAPYASVMGDIFKNRQL